MTALACLHHCNILTFNISEFLHKLKKYSRCSISGASSVKTFDGMTYRMNSECTYIFATDCVNYEFFIYGTVGPCEPGVDVNCLHSMTFFRDIDAVQVGTELLPHKTHWG